MSLSGRKWQTQFSGADNVNDLCSVLDQTDNTFNTVHVEAIGGFFTFGMSWLIPILRNIDNSWNGRNRYRNLRALWDDVTERTDKILKDNKVFENIPENVSKGEELRNCVRLTLALCARVHEDVEANYQKIKPNGRITHDKSSRSRWNDSNRENVKDILDKTEFQLNNGDVKGNWFFILNNHWHKLKGAMGPYMNAPEGRDIITHMRSESSKKTDTNK